mmetsp:Transcript_105246/g.224820  ORF Transcript_105246/g.224820 Transcript_105246/m.224820 type:complete len:278 (-) Transcript_105246:1682-2515(-)
MVVDPSNHEPLFHGQRECGPTGGVAAEAHGEGALPDTEKEGPALLVISLRSPWRAEHQVVLGVHSRDLRVAEVPCSPSPDAGHGREAHADKAQLLRRGYVQGLGRCPHARGDLHRHGVREDVGLEVRRRLTDVDAAGQVAFAGEVREHCVPSFARDRIGTLADNSPEAGTLGLVVLLNLREELLHHRQVLMHPVKAAKFFRVDNAVLVAISEIEGFLPVDSGRGVGGPQLPHFSPHKEGHSLDTDDRIHLLGVGGCQVLAHLVPGIVLAPIGLRHPA